MKVAEFFKWYILYTHIICLMSEEKNKISADSVTVIDYR